MNILSKLLFGIKLGFGAAVSTLSYLMGGFDVLFYCLTTLIIIDYTSGVLAAVCYGRLSSRTGFLGIIKKICIYLVVAVATVIGNITGVEGVRDIAVSFYIANEGISILENLGKIGVPLPEKLKSILVQLKEEEE